MKWSDNKMGRPYQEVNTGKIHVFDFLRSWANLNKYIFEDLKDDCISDYEELIEAKLIFRDKDSLSKHINRIWSNPLDWWGEKSTKEAINKFNFKYNKNYKNNLNILPKIIDNIVK